MNLEKQKTTYILEWREYIWLLRNPGHANPYQAMLSA